MKSPFPGMDPYLEQSWRDVHAALLVYSRDQLQSQLPDNLYARVEEQIVLEYDEVARQSRYPDVRVVEYPRGGPVKFSSAGWSRCRGTGTDSLPRGTGHGNLHRNRRCWYRRRVVTVIEFLIPLREKDAGVYLKSQALIDLAYTNGRYHTINYRVPADPPLEGADAEWADELLHRTEKR